MFLSYPLKEVLLENSWASEHMHRFVFTCKRRLTELQDRTRTRKAKLLALTTTTTELDPGLNFYRDYNAKPLFVNGKNQFSTKTFDWPLIGPEAQDVFLVLNTAPYLYQKTLMISREK
jgi:hypothetical protein